MKTVSFLSKKLLVFLLLFSFVPDWKLCCAPAISCPSIGFHTFQYGTHTISLLVFRPQISRGGKSNTLSYSHNFRNLIHAKAPGIYLGRALWIFKNRNCPRSKQAFESGLGAQVKFINLSRELYMGLTNFAKETLYQIFSIFAKASYLICCE